MDTDGDFDMCSVQEQVNVLFLELKLLPDMFKFLSFSQGVSFDLSSALGF